MLNTIQTSLASLIPLPIDKHPITGFALSSCDWRFERSTAYEMTVRRMLPVGWRLYADLDADRAPLSCARDFGACLPNGDEVARASVFGVRHNDGCPKLLRASIPGGGCKEFRLDQFALAIAWCQDRLVERAPS